MTRTAMLLAAATIAAPAAGAAELEKMRSPAEVAATIDALEEAVTGAGGTVFARVDHAAGAASAGMSLNPSQALIFGNPKLGTPAMQADPRAGLMLPLRVLAYEDAEGRTWVVWERPEETLDGLNVEDEADYVVRMDKALSDLVGQAIGADDM